MELVMGCFDGEVVVRVVDGQHFRQQVGAG